jgi:hypothetical protein
MNTVKLEITVNHRDDIQRTPQCPAGKPGFGKGFLESRFSKPLLPVSQIESTDQSIRRIACHLREIQDGVQTAGRILMRTDRHRCGQSQEAAVEEALNYLSSCTDQISEDLYPLLKRLSQRKNNNS